MSPEFNRRIINLRYIIKATSWLINYKAIMILKDILRIVALQVGIHRYTYKPGQNTPIKQPTYYTSTSLRQDKSTHSIE